MLKNCSLGGLNRKRLFQFTIAVELVILSCLKVMAGSSVIGKPAPFFRIKSGEDKILTKNMTKGKVIVLFYETKDVVKKNKELKDALKKLYTDQTQALQKLVLRLVVINCTEAYWPITKFWKNKLYESSLKQGFTIYGDWDGSMFADYHMKDNESNFMIIDKQGIIRYYQTGKIPRGSINKIKDLLVELVNK